jgi:GntR family transcriptional regulator
MMASMPGPAAPSRISLSDRVSFDLVERLQRGDWKAGERLPTEHQLAEEYGVSRATVRSALRRLESLGLTVTRHGLGTFASAGNGEIRADLRRLDSLSVTIATYGLSPSMRYRTRVIRPASALERQRLDLPLRAKVLATERALSADGTVVAFSYDAIDRRLLPTNYDPSQPDGSLFSLLDQHGARVATAVSEIHAATGTDIGWGKRPRRAAFVLLSQVHYLDNARPAMYSNTYFIEGRFTFSLIRTR